MTTALVDLSYLFSIDWIEAQKAGMAPKIVLESCHLSVTEFVDLELLKQYAVKENI
jgi:uncharacterized protein (DUF2237 family)